MVSLNRNRSTVLAVLGIILLVASATILGSYYFGQGRTGQTLTSAPLPPGLSPAPPSTSAPAPSGAPPPSTSAPAPSGAPTPSGAPAPSGAPVPTRSPTAVPVKTGIPVTVIPPDNRVQAKVSANRMNADSSLYVPPDPRAISWASQQVPPGSAFGTTILVGHINNGGVAGVFSDLADYRVGQVITLVLADGRRLDYAVAAPPREVNKDNVGHRRQELFDQTNSYGLPGRPKSGRLLLLSCGGLFDNRTGHYESNIFVYALPV